MKGQGLVNIYGWTVVLFLLWSCSTVPYTGRSQLILTSTSEENSFGDEAWKEILSKEKISNDPNYNRLLKSCGTNIAKVADRPDFRWEFRVIEKPEVNAFCLPGGKVAVYTGLLKIVSNEAELAAVVGHEIGHAIARHGGERMSHEYIRQVGSQIAASGLSGDPNTQAWLAAYTGVSQLGIILPYSRIQEYESDQIGMMIMAKAGYDPRAALSFWEKMNSSGGNEWFLANFLSTHPVGAKRLEEMKKLLPEAQRLYESAQLKKGMGQILRK